MSRDRAKCVAQVSKVTGMSKNVAVKKTFGFGGAVRKYAGERGRIITPQVLLSGQKKQKFDSRLDNLRRC